MYKSMNIGIFLPSITIIIKIYNTILQIVMIEKTKLYY